MEHGQMHSEGHHHNVCKKKQRRRGSAPRKPAPNYKLSTYGSLGQRNVEEQGRGWG